MGNFSRFFIDRPIFASVLAIIIVLSGLVAGFSLPIAQYPEITPPTVEVSAVYPGANAQVVADTVAAPVEQQVNGVEGMLYMSSQCTNDGTYVLTVTPMARVTSGSVGWAMATRFCTSTWAMFTSVPSAKVTSRVYEPSLLL